MKVWWCMDRTPFDDARGGDPGSTRCLAIGLANRDHDVSIFNPVWPDSRLPFYIRTVRTASRFAKGLRKRFEAHPPSVVIAQNHVYPYVVREAKRAGVPVVLVARDKRYRCPQFPSEYMGCTGQCAWCVGKMALLPYPWFRHHVNMSREMAMASDAQVTVSKHMADDMRACIPGTDPVVIPPPWDGSEFPDQWEPRDVLFMGRGHYKGADVVLEIAEEMQDRPWRFRVCNGQEPALAMKFGALPNVDYLGFVDKRVAFSKARILICPARWDEPSSRSIVEAASIGIPTIASDVGGQREMVGIGGRLVDDPEDIDRWCMAIDALMTSPTMWLFDSLFAREHVREYHVEVAAERLERVLESVA